jgi:hypothetical protein
MEISKNNLILRVFFLYERFMGRGYMLNHVVNVEQQINFCDLVRTVFIKLPLVVLFLGGSLLGALIGLGVLMYQAPLLFAMSVGGAVLLIGICVGTVKAFNSDVAWAVDTWLAAKKHKYCPIFKIKQ